MQGAQNILFPEQMKPAIEEAGCNILNQQLATYIIIIQITYTCDVLKIYKYLIPVVHILNSSTLNFHYHFYNLESIYYAQHNTIGPRRASENIYEKFYLECKLKFQNISSSG